MQNILLLTATVTPHAGVPDLARSQSDLRRADYAAALAHHLRLLKDGVVDGLVYAENSGADLGFVEKLALQAGVRERVELVSCESSIGSAVFGRAYAEMRLVEHAVQHSRFLQHELSDNGFTWKVTGRYWIHNLGELIATRPADTDLYCNMRDFPSRWVDMYLLGWTRRGFNHFLADIADTLRVGLPTSREGDSPENLFRQELERRMLGGSLAPRFTKVPIIDGIRGFDNASYLETQTWKNRARRIALAIAPWLWI